MVSDRINRLKCLAPENLFHNAAVLAQHAKLAYLSKDRIENISDWPNTRAFVNLAAHGFAAWDDEDCVVAIAGTDDPSDALLDAMATYIELPGRFLAHTGFSLYAVLVREALTKLAIPTDRRYYFTGHSLGGAAATLMPLLCPSRPCARVVTFGAPRVLSECSAGSYMFPCLRFIKPNDIVPDYPPRRMLGYGHVGTEKILQGPAIMTSGKRDVLDRASRFFRFLRARCRGRKALKKAIVAGHSMKVYRDWLAPFL